MQEANERCQDMAVCASMLADKCKSLEALLGDYSRSDDAWTALQNQDYKSLKDNLSSWAPEQVGVQAVILSDLNQRIIASSGLNKDIEKAIFDTKKPEDAALGGKHCTGFVSCGNSIYIVSTAPVLKSSGVGPRTGALTFAKQVDSDVLTQLSSALDMRLAIYVDGKPATLAQNVSTKSLPEKPNITLREKIADGQSVISISDSGKLAYTWKSLQNWDGESVAMLVSSASRQEAISNTNAVMLRSFILIVCCLLVALLSTLQLKASSLAQHALTDELTGLHNHRFLQEHMELEMNRAKRYKRPMSIIMLDIDHFKYINDQHGHLVGDQALKGLSRLLNESMRETDIVARYGGEEFLIILPETFLHASMVAAERVRKLVEETIFDAKVVGSAGRGATKLPLRFTVSLGVASFPQHADRPDELIMAADLALFAAKNASRNAVRSYASIQDQELSESDGPLNIHMAMREGSLAAVRALAAAVEARDESMRGHSEKVAICSIAIGQAMRLSNEDMNTLRTAALLHDVGRIAIPDAIVQKPGALTDEEREVVKTHSVKGADILASAPQLAQVSKIVRHHHERYDGKGYPDGLEGENIPLLSRIIATADAFDAMTSSRAYRAASGIADTIISMWELAGLQFDPDVVKVLDQLVASGKLSSLLDSVRNNLNKAA